MVGLFDLCLNFASPRESRVPFKNACNFRQERNNLPPFALLEQSKTSKRLTVAQRHLQPQVLEEP